MPIEKHPFTAPRGGFCRPYLSVRITNPDTNLSVDTIGLIDTGADDCALPASYAVLLGHNLSKGNRRSVRTGNGTTVAYQHTMKFEILNPTDRSVVYVIDATPVDCLKDLRTVLLGVKNFLSKFVLTVDYTKKIFSIKYP